MRTTTAVLLGTALLLTGCTGSNDDEPAAASTTAEAADTEPTEEPEPEDSGPAALDLGDPWEWGTDDETLIGNTTVISYEQPITTAVSAEEDLGQPGYVWAALELKVCTDVGELWVSEGDWILAYEDGTRVESSSNTYDDFPRPEFPFEAEVRAGDCVRGKVVYPVPGKQRPERVLYTPNGDSEVTAEWAVPAK